MKDNTMDTMAISTKTIDSKEYKNSCDAMKCILILLKQQLEITKSLINKNNALKIKGYEQYHLDHSYSCNKGHDKITNVPCNPVSPYKLATLIAEIDKFFAWEKKYKEKTCI